ncbi:MAG: glycosyltransferase, partial [Nitrososphaeria archaeon]|nr:glycosyltransferase [Nitrososphaeria archaeon]
MDILIFNWRCPKHPQAGGAEKVTYEVARRWVQWGHRVHLVCGNYAGGSRHDNIEGMEVTRLGGKYSLYPIVILHYLRKLRAKYDMVIDEINTVPFFTPKYVKEPKVAFIHQMAADILYEELPRVQAELWHFVEPRVLRL